jgi:hypothetical protein
MPGLERPSLIGRAPRGAEQLAVQPDVLVDPEAARTIAQVVEDLRLLGVAVGPVGLWRERERVQVRGHVALAPRIAVANQVPPICAPRSRTTKSSMPSCFRRIAAPSPPSPAPMMAMSASGIERLARWTPETGGVVSWDSVVSMLPPRLVGSCWPDRRASGDRSRLWEARVVARSAASGPRPDTVRRPRAGAGERPPFCWGETRYA